MGQRKTFTARMELKLDTKGAFEAVFATLNVIDHDGDVTLPGAFKPGQAVVIEGWNHDAGLPVGRGTIHSDNKTAVVTGRFFLDTTVGQDHYNTVKALRPEWSYTFAIEDAEEGTFEGQRVRFLKALDVWGVSPVTRGAGITHTVAVKRLHRGRLDPLDVLGEIYALTAWTWGVKDGRPMTPAEARIELDALLIDNEISDIAGRVKARGSDHPTNRDRIRARLAEAWPGTSAAWLEAMTAAELAQMARDLEARDVGINDAVSAARIVGAWARQAA